MNHDQLVTAGLNEQQAKAYGFLLEHGQAYPPTMATKLKLSRTNSYKVLDSLEELGLAKREEIKKKYIYFPDNPMALNNLVNRQRSIAQAQEEAVRDVMNSLLASYHEHIDQPDVTVVTGKDKVLAAYKDQLRLVKPIYFIRSLSDMSLGYDEMVEIRTTPARFKQDRFGITPDSKGVKAKKDNKSSRLERTWMKREDYTAPVEWSACGDTLLIVVFAKEPHAITITNPIVAEAFKQLFMLLNNTLKAMPYYKTLPRNK